MAQAFDFPVERASWNPATAWRRFCGFLDVPIETFMEIQSQLLHEQIDLIAECRIGRRLFRNGKPESLAEFREKIPLSTYGDYVKLLAPGMESNLPKGEYIWTHTTGAQAGYKWVPYSTRGFTRCLDNLMAAMMLSAAQSPGDLNISPGDIVMFNVPPRPYLSGLVAFGMLRRFGLKAVSDPAATENMDFKEKVALDFRSALTKRVDLVIAMTSVLVRAGQRFEQEVSSSTAPTETRQQGLPKSPRAITRMLSAKAKSIALRRPIRPRDLWPTRAIIGWGADTPIFKNEVKNYWGQYPYEVYACTEGGVMGMQNWDRKGLVFNPYANLYEFIPEEENRRAREDDRYQPRTVLLSEVKGGETYEVVLTNFYGMPLLRYRVGHFIKFLPKETWSAPGRPEFEWLGRSDDRIDIAGFTRVDEKTVWQALRDAGLDFSNWTLKREQAEGKTTLHFYGESRHSYDPADVASRIHQALKSIDAFYADLEKMLEIRPLKTTLLPVGTFDRYYEEKRRQGRDLGSSVPPRMNAYDDTIADLVRLAAEPQSKRATGTAAR